MRLFAPTWLKSCFEACWLLTACWDWGAAEDNTSAIRHWLHLLQPLIPVRHQLPSLLCQRRSPFPLYRLSSAEGLDKILKNVIFLEEYSHSLSWKVSIFYYLVSQRTEVCSMSIQPFPFLPKVLNFLSPSAEFPREVKVSAASVL